MADDAPTVDDAPTTDRDADAGTPTTDYGFLADALTEADAVAFVHVGGVDDPGLRYLSRLDDSAYEFGFVYVDGEPVLCAPPDADAEAFPGGVFRQSPTADTGVRVVAALDEVRDRGDGSDTVVVPRHLPHDAAVYLERAGYDLVSTTAVSRARAVKSEEELGRLRSVQRAAVRSVDRARSILAASAVKGDRLHWKGTPLSTDRLCREVNATLASEGVAGVEHTQVAVDGTSASRPTPLRAGDPVVVSLAPRGPSGYYGTVTRTFVVDSDGGWDRRAHVGVDAARRVALVELEPGASLRWVHSEVVAEASSFGLTPTAGDRVYGVGLSRRERPLVADGGDESDADDEVDVGHVVALAPSVTDGENGTVALADLAVVTDDGCELLADTSTSLVP